MLECGITVLSKINEKKFSDLEFLKYFEPQKYHKIFLVQKMVCQN